jgi:hypothetical protein
MAEVLTVVTLMPLSGLVKDEVQNHFNFRTATSGAPTTAELDAIHSALDAFYNTGAGSPSHAICNLIGTQMAHSSAVSKMQHYNVTTHLDGSAHGAPVRTDTWTLGSAIGTGDNLPSEVSVCLTFQTPYLTDPEFGPSGSRPRARDRGRIYLGPVRDAIRLDNSNHEPRIDPDWRQAIGAAAARLVADADTQWVIWSRANTVTNTVSNGWVDEAFDTQRRRGPDSTARSLWP